jgi:hypothetical protein
MSDIVDRGNDAAEVFLDAALRNRKKVPELPLTGYCHNCGTATQARFCDVDCRDDFEKHAHAR